MHCSRYGSEINQLLLGIDGAILAETAQAEGDYVVFDIPLPYLEAGDHVLVIRCIGGGADNGNYLDGIRLVGPVCEGLSDELCDGIDNNCSCEIDEGC